MSHTTTIELQIKSIPALKNACTDLGFSFQENTTATLFDKSQHTGFVMQLPKWNYPVIAADGKLYYDNYKGQWGDEKHLTALKQRYSVNVQKEQARARGYRVKEEQVGGKVKLTLER